MMPMKDGSLRIVQDFRQLNAQSQDEFIGDVVRARSTIFTTLDPTLGLWQMPL
jgi:hypothetical protein